MDWRRLPDPENLPPVTRKGKRQACLLGCVLAPVIALVALAVLGAVFLAFVYLPTAATCALLGLLEAAALLGLWTQRRLQRYGIALHGFVERLDKHWVTDDEGHGDWVYVARIRVEAPDGRSVLVRGRGREDTPIGEPRVVHYDPRKPDRIVERETRWGYRLMIVSTVLWTAGTAWCWIRVLSGGRMHYFD
ncbi:hypothetical protein [Embleya hyalina]|uniref:DUF3592 domain-containing protein n=1 Tax=Embleya hyalina TaxID=516124 RepID=A0A401YN10_9ACTN|nr:hypothetical protein [Embleya hyalina]GCD95971.1 hypothetical protein EHYA_03655 [Embleya hyalina]